MDLFQPGFYFSVINKVNQFFWERSCKRVSSRLDCEKHPFSDVKLKKRQIVREALLMGSDWVTAASGPTAAVGRQPGVVLCGCC